MIIQPPEEGMMNDSIRVIRRPRWAWPPAARTAAAIVATAGLAWLAAACASPSSTGPGGSSNAAVAANIQSTNSQKTLAYSHCMRSHDVPNFPDPDSSGNLPASAKQIAASDPQAQTACRDLLPNGSQPPQAKPRSTGSGAQNQPQAKKTGSGAQNQPQAKKTGSGAQNQPPQAKPASGGGQ
jgi:hypothetical protein